MRLKPLITALAVVLTLGSGITARAAREQDAPPIDELWGQPILAYGSSLTDEQFEEILNIFGIGPNDADQIYVSGPDVVRFLGVGNANTRMFSSALIDRGEPGSGIIVNILTPENITRVTRNQYANAMISAGVTDAVVKVAAPLPVTGESALAGIFKAYSDRGIELEEDRMKLAQQELETTTRIAAEYEDHQDFESENLDHALIDIKSNLADIKSSTGYLANEAEVIEIVQAALADNSLSGIISQENVQRLVSLAQTYQNTSAITSEQVREQLQNLAQNVSNGWETLRDHAIEAGVLESVGNFFTRLFDLARGFFRNN